MRRSSLAPLFTLLVTPFAMASDPGIEEIARNHERLLSGKGSDYADEGRRDPFVDPRSAFRGEDPARSPGLAGQRIAELKLEGLSVIAGMPIAMVSGSDGVGYLAREGDGVRDGRVLAIDFAHGRLTLQQRVDDTGSAVRYRSVELTLDAR